MIDYFIILALAYVALYWRQLIAWRVNCKRRLWHKRSTYYWRPPVTDPDFPYEPMEY